jgi:hypothetical protein
MRIAALPDDLEMILEEYRLSVRTALILAELVAYFLLIQAFAPALRAHLSCGDDQVKCFAKLQTADLCAAVDASLESLKQQLIMMHSSVQKAIEATLQLQKDVDEDPTNQKFSTFKAAGGTIDDFFNGLEDRIGEDVGVFWFSEGARF